MERGNQRWDPLLRLVGAPGGSDAPFWTCLGLRLALATTFLSAVALRVGLWGRYSSEWPAFLAYTQ